MNYTYDQLNRLLSTASTGGATTWAENYQYDGFGNLTQKVRASSWGVDPNTNRFGTTDANGNFLCSGCAYDVENRLILNATWSGTPMAGIGYAPDNKRVWELKQTAPETWVDWISFYGVDGQRLGIYQVEMASVGNRPVPQARSYIAQANYYFRGRMIYQQTGASGQLDAIMHDRLGSVVARGYSTFTKFRYRPYGDEEPWATAQDREKFGTYWRDSTGMDYADQRHHQWQFGRFNTPDPYKASVGPRDPGSWNRYAYVQGDPVNFNDPAGLVRCFVVRTVEGDSGRTADVQCTTAFGTIVTRQTDIGATPTEPKALERFARDAEQSWGRELEQGEIHQQIDPLIELARKAFANDDCAGLFSGTNVISPTEALNSIDSRIMVSFGSIHTLIGAPRTAQTRGDGLRPSIILPGFYYQRALIRFDVNYWSISNTQDHLEGFIHELGHAIHFLSVGRITGGFVHEDQSVRVNEQNDRLIQENCVNAVLAR